MDDLQIKIASGIIVEVFKETLKGAKSFDTWIRAKTKGYDLLGTASSKYVTAIQDKYSHVRIFSMPRPVPLRKIFVDVNILEKRSTSFAMSLEGLEKAFKKDRKGFGEVIKRQSGLETVNDLDKIMVFGKPGAGKSTFLKSLMLATIDGNTSKKMIPIFISLKDWSDSELELLDYIIKEFDVCDFPDSKEFLTILLKKGNALLLLDGFDEITKNIDESIFRMKQFLSKFSENKAIISCRIAARDYIFEDFTEIEIADFSTNQIYQFVDNWYGTETKKAELCKEKISQDIAIHELATIPLLLTMLCVAFDELMDFPSNKSELYKEALDALLKKWDSSRSIKRDVVYKKLSIKRKEDLLSKIAYQTFINDEYFISQNRLEKLISEYIENIPGQDISALVPDSLTVLRAIEAQHGLLVTRAKRIYSFSHLTFQEYYTSKYIVDHLSPENLNNLINDYLFNPKWHEVFLLIPGLLSEADSYLLSIKNRIEELQNSSAIQLIREILISRNINALDLEEKVEMIDAIKFLKNSVVKLQQYSAASILRDIEKELLRSVESKKDEINIDTDSNIIGNLCYNYYYSNALLELCLKSECYIKKSTRAYLNMFLDKSVIGEFFQNIKEEISEYDTLSSYKIRYSIKKNHNK